jgi:hypothetical protein
VNYSNTEHLRLHGGGGTAQDTITINGTGGPNAFTATLDATVIAGLDLDGNAANDRHDFSVQVDGGTAIHGYELGQNAGPTNVSDLQLRGLGGDDTFAVSHFTGAVLDQIVLDGGPPSASDEVQISGTAAADTICYTANVWPRSSRSPAISWSMSSRRLSTH